MTILRPIDELPGPRYDVCVPMKYKNDMEIKIPHRRFIISTAPSLPAARNELMEKTTSKWFWFIDDDVETNLSWFYQVLDERDKLLKKGIKVGAIGGYALSESWILNTIRAFLVWTRGTKNQKGFTSNTLILKEAVKGVRLTKPYNEDQELKAAIEANGYKWIQTNARCKHLKPGKKVWKDSVKYFINFVKEEGIWKAFLRI